MPRYLAESTSDLLESLVLRDLERDALVAVAPTRGGMITRFSIAGAAVLYLDESTLRDPSKSVRGGIPLLLPIAGRLADDRYTTREGPRSMRQHGFARNLPWSVDSATSDLSGAEVTLRLRPDASTREQFPFEFEFLARYRLSEGALSLALTATCRGGGPMPIQVGTHPYFYVQRETKSAARVETRATRQWDNVVRRELTHRELTRREPEQSTLPDLGLGEIDRHLLDHSSRSTVLHRPGACDIKISWSDNLPTLVVWTLPERDFVCVEPWSAPADAFNRSTVSTLADGASETWTTVISTA